MKITKLRGCPDGRTCPGVYATDRGTLLIQGAIVTDPEALDGVPPGETVVEVPRSLFPEV